MKIFSIKLLVFFISIGYSFAQTRSISGSVHSSQGLPIPFVNIGIKGENVGTITNKQGQFNIMIPDSLRNRDVVFSCVGFQERRIPVTSNFFSKSDAIIMEERVTQLAEVMIKPKKGKLQKLGIRGRTPFVMTASESYSTNDIIEQARIIELRQECKLVNANIFIMQTALDSITLRLNFYGISNGTPGERLINQSIIKTFAAKQGWLTFDLNDNNIYLRDNFFVSFEYLPVEKKTAKKVPICYGAKLGSSGTFMRKGSQASWEKLQGGSTTIYVTVKI